MSKLELTDNLITSITKLCDGNPGAATALAQLTADYEKIDPDSSFGYLSPLLSFDSYEVYGTEIYIIWNDKCKRDPRTTALLLRGVQLGFLPVSQFKQMAEDQMNQINLTKEEWENLEKQVTEFLPNFKKVN